MRECLVIELVKEVLGPRGGSRETLGDDPRNEYVTGILTPEVAVPPRDLDAEAGFPVEDEGMSGGLGGSEEGDKDVSDQDLSPPPFLSPALDPKALPRSIGLSFVAERREGNAEVEVCVTWARYVRNEHQWVRQPRYFLTGPLGVASLTPVLWVNSSGRCAQHQAEVSLHIHSDPLDGSNNRFRVILQLVNRLEQDHIFQPQIRVHCLPGTMIVQGLGTIPSDEEEEELNFLYRELPVLAKGYLCSAIWRDVDPERPAPQGETLPEAPPFYWVDGDLLPTVERRKFSPADVRTEFVPIYPVESPELTWNSVHGPPPELRSEVLAEKWNPVDMVQSLQPLIDGYRHWIEQLVSQMNHLPDHQSRIADALIHRCRQVLGRMQAGLELLMNDPDARLAFCFANKAMELQSRWSRHGQSLEWYPFQLAFFMMTLESAANSSSLDRATCDLVWVPTGAGKTEAYLAIAAFTLALRRRKALQRTSGDRSGAGTAVISRYTLRLLTIQQFRRALGLITACEYLRVHGLASGSAAGWRPAACHIADDFIWGSTRFSTGLWVGGGVTPNRLLDTWGSNRQVPGAISILRGKNGEGEPAQVLNCPTCGSILAIPHMGLQRGTHALHLVISTSLSYEQIQGYASTLARFSVRVFNVTAVAVHSHPTGGYFTLSLSFLNSQDATPEDVDRWWNHIRTVLENQVRLEAVRASRPGYFVRQYRTPQNKYRDSDFDVYCPDPECCLNSGVLWVDGSPARVSSGIIPSAVSPLTRDLALPDGNNFAPVPKPFRIRAPRASPYFSWRIPIPAYTVDDQVYHRCPSLVVATVDKFARLPFEPKCASLFGNVDYYHETWGYYRQHQPPYTGQAHQNGHPSPVGSEGQRRYISIPPLDPPELIIQDELHLIEGPLGSMVGIYETAVNELCRNGGCSVKYVASSATVRQAEQQVQSVFNRRLLSFPPAGLTADERFFLRFRESHPIEDGRPGRLYLGTCAPGKGPLTPAVRIWSRLLQTSYNMAVRAGGTADPFWTLTGYFNAIRELAGARALRQDILERLRKIAGHLARALPDDRLQELSSRTDATNLPAILNLLNRGYPEAQDAFFTTSMFGTGVDIPRLALMVVHGQPKTTSAYIQATGRVGRTLGALVVTFLRGARPRDLNHYEFFCGYHRQLHRFVESVTVMPFSSGALDRACGSVAVAILRNMRIPQEPWHMNGSAPHMAWGRTTDPEVENLPRILESRAQSQPEARQLQPGTAANFAGSELDRWQQIAKRVTNNLEYVEYDSPPTRPVVLGDPAHAYARLDIVYENVPQSLRDIEETTGFQT